MVYSNKLVACVQQNGKVLREQGDAVYLPLGTEYQILIKNLNSRKAKVNISIDGQDVVQGSLLVEPNSSMVLERFVKSDLCKGNRFRFIEKTKEISDYRGDKPDDGLVRLEYWFEKPLPTITWTSWEPYLRSPQPWNPPYTFTGFSNCGTGLSSDNQVNCCVGSSDVEGITVPGSVSHQQFQYGSIGQLEPHSDVIIIRLRGYKEDKPITKPLFTSTKLICQVCGQSSSSSAKFCSRCSTALVWG